MVKAGLGTVEQGNTPDICAEPWQLILERSKEFWCRAWSELQKGLKKKAEKVGESQRGQDWPLCGCRQ